MSALWSEVLQEPGPALSKTERAVRNSLESLAGRAFANIEWDRASARLLEFVKILRSWDHNTNS